MLYGFVNILQIFLYIPHIQIKYGEYFMECRQSHKTLLWIWIILCMSTT